MRIRLVASGICRAAAGILSFAVSGYGVYSFGSADLRRDTAVMFLFCLLPALSLPVFLLSFRSFRWSAALHWALAGGYLAVYSMLDWRTCAELGYCNGVRQTVLETLRLRPVEACFAVAVFNLAALLLNGKRAGAAPANPLTT